MIEAQSRYISTLVSQIILAQRRGATLALRPKTEALQLSNDQVQSILRKSSFADPKCNSWYKTEDGRITNNWSGTVVEYQKQLSSVRWDDYIVEGTAKPLMEKKRATSIGRVREETFVGRASLLLGMASLLVALGSYYTKGSILLR